MSGSIQHFSADRVVEWYQQDDVEMIVGDALDPASDPPLIAGYAHYRKGSSNQITLPYDEVLVITKGVFTVRRADGVVTASAGEGIFHQAGATVVYEADEDTELVYVSHPPLRLRPIGGFHRADPAIVARLTARPAGRRDA
jgi:ethanolamine utilization protein EutQ